MINFKKAAVAALPVAGLALSLTAPSAGAQSEISSYGIEAESAPSFAPQTYKGGCVDYSSSLGSAISSSSVRGNVAEFTVRPGACPVKMTFTSYTLPSGWVMPFEKQIPTDSKTAMYSPGTYTVKLASLPCNWQSDLYFGDIQPHLNASYGHSNLVPGGMNRAYDYSQGNRCGSTSVSPAGVCVYRGEGNVIGVFKADNAGASATLPVGPANNVNAGQVFLQETVFANGATNPSAVADLRDLGAGWMSASYTLDGKTAVVNNDTRNCDSKPLSADTGGLVVPVAAAVGAAAVAATAFARRRRTV